MIAQNCPKDIMRTIKRTNAFAHIKSCEALGRVLLRGGKAQVRMSQPKGCGKCTLAHLSGNHFSRDFATFKIYERARSVHRSHNIMATVLWDLICALYGAEEKERGNPKIYTIFFVEKKESTRVEFKSHRLGQNTNSSQGTKKPFWFCQDLLRLEGMCDCVWRVPNSFAKKQRESIRCVGFTQLISL